ncbi:MAG: pirin family protein [Pseudomonadota bacterium]|nr:pirin family protein [Pseudomonadota bacterium]
MSYVPAKESVCQTNNCPEDVEMILIPRTVDLGGFQVSRILPSLLRRMVGPFVFWDQFGRNEFLTGQGIDVRPHPHIGLATLTYLFNGSIVHRDNLGNQQLITPGDVNLMVAGRGIAHSERTGSEERQHPHTLFGLQIWLGLPSDQQEIAPAFTHYSHNTLSLISAEGVTLRVVAGEFQGICSPVDPVADALLVDVELQPNATILYPALTEERAIHIVSGQISIGYKTYDTAHMLILEPGHPVVIKAVTIAKIILLGGATLDGPRYLWWNFVSTSKERIEQAKQDWINGRFAKIPGDDQEFIPLPEK